MASKTAFVSFTLTPATSAIAEHTGAMSATDFLLSATLVAPDETLSAAVGVAARMALAAAFDAASVILGAAFGGAVRRPFAVCMEFCAITTTGNGSVRKGAAWANRTTATHLNIKQLSK